MPRLKADEFPKKVKVAAAQRVGYRCSNPHCQKSTAGPSSDPQKAVSIGKAAHITAAAKGGPRYEMNLTSEQRRSIDNAIWLCSDCATLIDTDEIRFSVALLRQWRERAEGRATMEIRGGSEYREIAPSELVVDLEPWAAIAVKELQVEFGCKVRAPASVPAGDGWLNLDGAVVHGETLVAIEFYHNFAPRFRVEHILELCNTVKFERFRSCIAYIVVVADGDPENDIETERQLQDIADKSPTETRIRLYRMNSLRAKFEA